MQLEPRHRYTRSQKQNFGTALMRLAERRGFQTQRALAAATGLGSFQISAYARGAYFPTNKNLNRIATALGVAADELRRSVGTSAALPTNLDGTPKPRLIGDVYRLKAVGEPTAERFGKNLRTLVFDRGYTTQTAFAQEVGMSQVSVGNYFHGRTLPSLRSYGRIARALGITPRDAERLASCELIPLSQQPTVDVPAPSPDSAVATITIPPRAVIDNMEVRTTLVDGKLGITISNIAPNVASDLIASLLKRAPLAA